LVSIAVTPAGPSIAKGLTQQFVATGTYTDQSTQILTGSVTWNSSGTITAEGLATGSAIGTSNITASLGGVTSPIDVLTVTAPTLVSIAVTPANPSIVVLTPQQFRATGTYTDGTAPDLSGQVTWSSQTTGAATINGSGVASGVAVGATNITATLRFISGSSILTVLPLGPCSVSAIGFFTVADAQAIVNQALGITQAVNDLSGDRIVNLMDIQLLVGAILNSGCTQ
jgi:hypothetical protein